MKIQSIEISEIQIPLVTPFRTALRTVEAVDDIVIRVVSDDGQVGYGEAPPTAVITGDTKGSIVAAIRDFIAPTLIGREVDDMDGLMQALHGSILKNTSAKAAVDFLRQGQSFFRGTPQYDTIQGKPPLPQIRFYTGDGARLAG